MRHLVTQTSITLGIAGDEGMVEAEGVFWDGRNEDIYRCFSAYDQGLIPRFIETYFRLYLFSCTLYDIRTDILLYCVTAYVIKELFGNK